MCLGVVSVCPRHPRQVHLLSECKNPKIRLSVSLTAESNFVIPFNASGRRVFTFFRLFLSITRALTASVYRVSRV